MNCDRVAIHTRKVNSRATSPPSGAAAGQREDPANFFPRGRNRKGEVALGRKDQEGLGHGGCL
jgi:hypothetical protein